MCMRGWSFGVSNSFRQTTLEVSDKLYILYNNIKNSMNPKCTRNSAMEVSRRRFHLTSNFQNATTGSEASHKAW